MNRIASAQWVIVVLILTLVGTVSAVAAGVVEQIDMVIITSGPSGNPNAVASAGTVQLNVAATDSLGYNLTYKWTAQDTTGHAAGSFNDATAQKPIWTAPANTSDAEQPYRIRVVVTSVPVLTETFAAPVQSASSGYWQRVWAAADSVSITAGPAGDPNPVASGGQVHLSATATDTGGHPVTYMWTAEDLAGTSFGSFDDATKQNPVWTAPMNGTALVQVYNLKVMATCSHGRTAGAFLREQVLRASHTSELTATATGTPVPVASGGTVTCTVNANDTQGHDMTYLWTATDPAGDPIGGFDNATLASPQWTAPINNGGADEACRMTVTVTSTDGKSLTVAFRENIKPVLVGSEYVEITEGPSGDPNPVASDGQVELSVTATDSLGHPLTYQWTARNSAGPAAGAFDDATAQNPVWTAPDNLGSGLASYTIKVVVTSSTGAIAFTSYTQKVGPESQGEGVPLGSAAAFAVLAGSTVTNVPSLPATVVNGDLGLSPGKLLAVTGFPPGIVNGTIHAGDPVAAQAQVDLTTAYNDAAKPSLNVITVPSGELGGRTLAPGVYMSGISSFAITSVDLTLDAQGDSNAVWIFQMPSSTLTVGNGRTVTLIRGAQAANIIWQVGSSATLGTTVHFKGNILAQASISLGTGSTLVGRALARTGAVTLDDNNVTRP